MATRMYGEIVRPRTEPPPAPERPVGGRVFRVAVICFFLVAGGTWVQIKRSRQIHPPSPPVPAEWRHGEPVAFLLGRPGFRYPGFRMPGRRQLPEDATAALRVHVPASRWGYVLNLTVRGSDAEPTELRVLVNDEPVGRYRVNRDVDAGRVECFIPGRLLTAGEQNPVEVRNVGPGAWSGRLMLIAFGSARGVLPLVFPLLGALVLLAAAVSLPERASVKRGALFFGVAFFVYLYSLFTRQIAPGGEGVDFPAGSALIQPLLDNRMADGLTRHMLFLPALRLVFWVMGVFRQPELLSLALVCSALGGLNAVLAVHLFRMLAGSARTATLLGVCYVFAFSIWLHASVCAPAIFSALMLNLFLIYFLRGPSPPRAGRTLRECVLAILCGLAHPSLLILCGASVARWLRSSVGRGRKVVAAVAIVCLTAGGFLPAQHGLRRLYREPGTDPAAASAMEAAGAAATGIDVGGETAHMTVRNAGNLLLGQFLYAFGGQPPGFDWRQGWSGLLAYFTDPLGLVLVGLLTGLFLMASAGLLVDPENARKLAFMLTCLVVPYLLFFYYVNPREMLLYAPPFVSLVLGGIGWGAALLPRQGVNIAVGMTASVIALMNTLILVQYY